MKICLTIVIICLFFTGSAFAQKSNTDTLVYKTYSSDLFQSAFNKTKADSEPKAESTYAYPIFISEDADANWLNMQIKRILGIRNNLSFERGVGKLRAKYFANYKSEVKKYGQGKNSPTFNYVSTNKISVSYNCFGYVVIVYENYDYSGGAHGNYSRKIDCFDLQNKKRLQLSDLLHIDSAMLRHLIERQFRKDRALSGTDALNTVLFSNTLPANKNFYFNKEGIGFIYNPYEVAPYSEGTIDVFLPYSAIREYLTPAFGSRMHLLNNN